MKALWLARTKRPRAKTRSPHLQLQYRQVQSDASGLFGVRNRAHLLLRHRYPHQARVRPRYFPGITSMRCSI